MNKGLRNLLFGLLFVGLIFGCMGVIAGISMGQLASISGDSVAEAFYNQMGGFAIGVVGLMALLLASSVLRLMVLDREVALAEETVELLRRIAQR